MNCQKVPIFCCWITSHPAMNGSAAVVFQPVLLIVQHALGTHLLPLRPALHARAAGLRQVMERAKVRQSALILLVSQVAQ